MTTPFEIAVPDAELADLRERLARARWPDSVGAPWDYGTDIGWLREVAGYWQDGFDWRAQEARLNELDQFVIDIEGRDVHYIHARSPEPGAQPLILIHGWPGSFIEFARVVGPLCDPVAHGGKAEDAFHVVVPSIPGYGFSQAPAEPGFDAQAAARVMCKLMARLGYENYLAQGGDWGSAISRWMALVDPAVQGIHLNLVFAAKPGGVQDPWQGVTEEERTRSEALRERMALETGYQAIQGTKPQTLGYGLNDSPLGLLAWIGEKFRRWSDCDGTMENAISRDDLLTNVMIYWITSSITSSARLYFENRASAAKGLARLTPVTVPTACAIFPGELFIPPRKWAEHHYNVVQWTEMPQGGHFAALEQPDLLVEDIRRFNQYFNVALT